LSVCGGGFPQDRGEGSEIGAHTPPKNSIQGFLVPTVSMTQICILQGTASSRVLALVGARVGLGECGPTEGAPPPTTSSANASACKPTPAALPVPRGGPAGVAVAVEGGG